MYYLQRLDELALAIYYRLKYLPRGKTKAFLTGFLKGYIKARHPQISLLEDDN